MLRLPRHSRPVFAAPLRARRGFSLVELLVVVAMIGIISGLLITSYGHGHHVAMRRMVDQRNAQEIVSLGVCATMGGADFVVKDDKRATVENLIKGTVGKQGLWKGKIFRLAGLDHHRIPDALDFVRFEAGLLLYEPAGGQL